MGRRIGLGLVAAVLLMMGVLSAGIGTSGAGASPVAGTPSPLGHPSGNPGTGSPSTTHLRHDAGSGPSSHTVVPGPWSIAATPNVSEENVLSYDSCVSSDFCVAVGSNQAGTYYRTLIEMWNGSTWSVVTSPNTSATEGNFLSGVSCVTTSFCVASGGTQGGAVTDHLIEEWNGASWSIVSSPNVPSSTETDLYGVSCASPTFCEAVGEYRTNTVSQSVALGWNGSTWSIQTTPDPSSTDSYFNNVTCRSATWCIGVGAAQSGGHSATLVSEWNGSTWSVVPSPTPSAGAYLDDVSCPSATFCAAVGYTDDSVSAPLIEQWNGTVWTIAASPAAAGSVDDQLWSVSCVGPTYCSTVGYNYTNASEGYYVTEALVWNGSTWTQQPPVNPAVDTPGENYAELYGVSCVGGQQCVAVGDALPGNASNNTTLAETQSIVRPGYRFVAGDGGVFSFGGASFNGSAGGTPLNQPIVGMAATPDGGGYWLVAADGGIFSYGDAVFYGSTGSLTLNQPIVGMASTPDGGGYWLVASDGGIFAFGDATFYGSTGSLTLNQPVVGMAATPSGHGYWLVASDGGIFAYGDATFHGSAGSLILNKPVVGLAATPSGQGYWLVASDGGVFAYGDAVFYGSTGSLTLNSPIVGVSA